MDRKEYYHAMSQITSTDEKKEEVWGRIIEKSKSDIDKKWKIPNGYRCMAIAVLLLLLIVPGTVFADEVKDFFAGILRQDQNIEDYVKENVFEDSDDHVKIQVLELLSDEMMVNATVKIEALDEEGQKWLQSGIINVSNLSILPDDQGNAAEYGVTLSYGCLDMEEYRTDTTAVYFLTAEALFWNPSMAKCILTYPLKNGRHTVSLDTSTNVPVYEYRLLAKDDAALSRYYEPRMIRLSQLSYAIYGKNTGLIEIDGNSRRIPLSEQQYENETIEKVLLMYEDGTIVELEKSTGGLGEISEGTKKAGEDYDCIVHSGNLVNVSARLWGFEDETDIVVDIEKITGISIQNKMRTVEYEIVRD